MTITKAVILAAGVGLRMKEMGEGIPKSFIHIGERPIIEHSLRALIASGIQEVLIVTGHQSEYYENLKATYPEISTVRNSEFADTGTLCSLWCARNFIDSDIILLESDLIYEPTAISELLNIPYSDCLLLSGTTHAGDEVYVEADENGVSQISKDKDRIKNSVGEYMGIAKISKRLYAKLESIAVTSLKKNPKLSYDMDSLVQIAPEHPIHVLKLEGVAWAEIDDLTQLEQAKKVWKKINSLCPRISETL